MNSIINLLFSLKMFRLGLGKWRALMQQTKQPRKQQLQLLSAILKNNEQTAFGKEHNFSEVVDHRSYVENVPEQDYESLWPYIEKQEQDKTPELNSQNPILYAQTSGTTSEPKLIPILSHTVKHYQLSQSLVAYANYRACKGVFDGTILAIGSPAIEGYLDTGTPYGAVSGLVYQSMPKMVHRKYVLPSIIFDVEDYKAKYYLISAFAMRSFNVSIIATANPSTVMKILHTINQYKKEIVKDIRTGSLSNPFNIDAQVLQAINKNFHKDESRASELQTLIDDDETLSFAQLWPNLKALNVWTGGSVGVLIHEIRRQLPKETSIIELGYLSSELRGSINVAPNNDYCIPTIHENFFEFIAVEDMDKETSSYLLVDELELGKQYFVWVTTQEGLYRYFMNDIIEVNGFVNKTPSIKFIQKGKGVVSLTGEKLYEGQVIDAIENLKNTLELKFDFFILLGNEQAQCYKLFLDAEYANAPRVSEVLESALCELNVEFKSKRDSERLNPTKVIFVEKNTYEAYKNHCIDNGQREGQFKYLVLQNQKECNFDFSQHVVEVQ